MPNGVCKSSPSLATLALATEPCSNYLRFLVFVFTNFGNPGPHKFYRQSWASSKKKKWQFIDLCMLTTGEIFGFSQPIGLLERGLAKLCWWQFEFSEADCSLSFNPRRMSTKLSNMQFSSVIFSQFSNNF